MAFGLLYDPSCNMAFLAAMSLRAAGGVARQGAVELVLGGTVEFRTTVMTSERTRGTVTQRKGLSGQTSFARLTEHQQLILRKIRNCIARWAGRPTIQELGEFTGTSHAGTHVQLNHFVHKGYLRRELRGYLRRELRKPREVRRERGLHPQPLVPEGVPTGTAGAVAGGGRTFYARCFRGYPAPIPGTLLKARGFAVSTRRCGRSSTSSASRPSTGSPQVSPSTPGRTSPATCCSKAGWPPEGPFSPWMPHGEDMPDAGIHEDHIVIVLQPPPADRGGMMGPPLGDEMAVRRFYTGEQDTKLRPENRKYQPSTIGPRGRSRNSRTGGRCLAQEKPGQNGTAETTGEEVCSWPKWTYSSA